jgi:peptidyl-prolyl cis-trans isomerase D
MLNFFRRGGTGQILIGAVVFAIIIVFVLEFRPGREGAARLSQQCAVEVHNECVDRKEFFAAYGLIVPRGFTNKRVRSMSLRKHIQEGLVERELLVREAGRLGVSISDEELDDELSSGRAHISLPIGNAAWLGYSLELGEDWVRPLSVKSAQTNQFDYKIYERVVRNATNRSPKEFKEMQRREVIAARMRELIRSRVRVSESEAWLQYERERSTAVARVATIPRDWLARWAVDVSDAATDTWITANGAQVDDAWKGAKERFKPGCALVAEIVVGFEPDAPDETKVDKRQEIDRALQRLKNGESFERVARSASSGPSSLVGGERGCLGESDGPGAKELLDALKGMRPGAVSPVVETATGFHLLKLQGTLDEKSLEKVGRRVVARPLMARFRADELAKELAQKLIDKAQTTKLDDDLIQALAAELVSRLPKDKPKTGAQDEHPALADAGRPKLETSAPFPIMGSPVPDALPSERAALELFKLDKPDAVLTKPIATQSGLAVVQLKEKSVAKREEFEKDKAAALRTLRQAKGREALMRYLAALRNQSKDKIKLDAALAEEQGGGSDAEG